MATSFLPKISLRRTFLIARRDYLGYVKTVGFWVSFFLPFIGGAIGYGFTQLNVEFSPPRYEAILDETGQYADGIVNLHKKENERRFIRAIERTPEAILSDDEKKRLVQSVQEKGVSELKKEIENRVPSSAKSLSNFETKLKFVAPPAANLEGIKAYLTGDKTLSLDGKDRQLDGLLYITEKQGQPNVEYWSKNINSSEAKSLASQYFERRAEGQYLESAGLSRQGLLEARKGKLKVESFDPTKTATDTQSQAVTKADRIPYIVAAVLSGFLWLTVFSGAYMLLTSMLEEKLNKLLEMMLASTRFSEIIFGKLIGVAALTITAMAPYIILGVVGIVAFIFTQDSEMTRALAESFTPKLLIFFVVFLILGYIFYGACFIAMGALSQSMQDAQTITTPIVIVLTLCVMVVPLGLQTPDSPLLRLASFFPLSSPFAVIIRLPSDPPLWEIILSAVLLAFVSIGVIWASGRIFRYGVLSGSGVGAINNWFKRVILRQKA